MGITKLKCIFAVCAVASLLGLSSVASAQCSSPSQSSGSLSSGGIFCGCPIATFAGQTVTIQGTSVKQSNPLKPIPVKWSVWAGTTPTDFPTRIFKLADVSSVSQSGIQVPFLVNGTVYVEACVNNNSLTDISFTLSLSQP